MISRLTIAAFALTACSSSTTTTGTSSGEIDAGSDSGSSSPCGPDGVFGTFAIKGR